MALSIPSAPFRSRAPASAHWATIGSEYMVQRQTSSPPFKRAYGALLALQEHHASQLAAANQKHAEDTSDQHSAIADAKAIETMEILHHEAVPHSAPSLMDNDKPPSVSPADPTRIVAPLAFTDLLAGGRRHDTLIVLKRRPPLATFVHNPYSFDGPCEVDQGSSHHEDHRSNPKHATRPAVDQPPPAGDHWSTARNGEVPRW